MGLIGKRKLQPANSNTPRREATRTSNVLYSSNPAGDKGFRSLNRPHCRRKSSGSPASIERCSKAHGSAPRHEFGHFLDTFQWERRGAQGFHGDGHQFHRVVVCGYTVGTELSTAAATMDNGPFAILPDPHRYRFHDASTVRGAVPRLCVHVEAR